MKKIYNRRYWKKASKKKGLFGGNIKSKEEIWKLSQHIKKQEDAEFEEFEKQFDEELKKI